MARNFLLEIGQKIRKARKERKLSQKDLAVLVKCSPQLISKIEKGQVDTTITTLVSIQQSVGLEAGIQNDHFYEELEQWAKETGGSSNTEWLKNQIENFFPMFKEWKKNRVLRGEGKPEEPLVSKVAVGGGGK